MQMHQRQRMHRGPEHEPFKNRQTDAGSDRDYNSKGDGDADRDAQCTLPKTA